DEREREQFAWRPGVLAREPEGVRAAENRGQESGIDPGAVDVLGIDGQAWGQLEASALARRPKSRDLRPWSLGIDVVARHRGDPAPVVDPRVEELGESFVAQVRRRLDVPGRPEEDARRRDRPEEVVEGRLGRSGHLRVWLRAKVLHDQFLDVAVALAELTDREQRLD